MAKRELKIGDIADLTGLSERDVRALIQAYDSLFTYRTIGPVKIFSGNAVQIVRELIDLSRKGLTPEEIIEEVRSGGVSDAPEEPAAEVDWTGLQLPPGMVIDLQVMRETLARQERQIARLAADLEREREERREEVGRLRQTIDGLQGQLAVVAEWVDYFDLQIDEISLPMFERIRRAFGRETDPGQRT
ncbi:MAG TPA: hypothetical protein PKK74_04730 [Candidatus Methanoculleus thermohydrogenotrophicum]|jgi:DNA-binding transcriptional MerR regulator|nr:hypothetical protein [Candidatus Methanoculleus thermohydrogenotrophicum]NLM82237.1 hypothetical protein [Candidatus Methanoculleus thermohydrogenotrophicum]HOB17982.1 hypothetical protein [Candidatus Methanoculleus thermohydrogenotrophicum]HQC91339.1 hypothetical protein [Candidatus Methanoculleus thermohydrogenotrophicum]